MADCSMANSLLRMLVKEGLLWGFGLQHSEDQKTSEHLLYCKLKLTYVPHVCTFGLEGRDST